MLPSKLGLDDRIKFVHENMIEPIVEERLQQVCGEFMYDHGESFVQAPGATRHHHGYEGGLLDHTWEVFQIATSVGVVYPDIDLPLLQAGAFLHDIGKTYCYEDVPTGRKYKFKRAESSYILDHFGEGLLIVNPLLEDYCDDMLSEGIKHLIASHHGPVRFGWGSMVDPRTPEAHILHYADMISSRVGGQM